MNLRYLFGPAVLLIMAGCATDPVLLVHPKTGETQKCSTAEVGAGAHLHAADTRMRSCVHHWKSFGYLDVKELTPDQRASLAAKP